jgi:hypothetical protein
MNSPTQVPSDVQETNGLNVSAILQKDSVVDVEIPIRGLLVKESIVIYQSDQNQVAAHASNISHFCTGTYNYPLYIRVHGTNKALSCRLSDLLVSSGRMMLNDFRFIEQPWIDRQFERVQPREPIFVTLSEADNKFKANLFDVSLIGMCVFTDSTILERSSPLLGTKFTVLLRLPPRNQLCRVPGRVIQVRELHNNLIRVGLQIKPEGAEAATIAHYLSGRKREILDELLLNFRELLNYRQTKDMYF